MRKEMDTDPKAMSRRSSFRCLYFFVSRELRKEGKGHASRERICVAIDGRMGEEFTGLYILLSLLLASLES